MTPEMDKEMNDVHEFMDSTMLENNEHQGYMPVAADEGINKDRSNMI